jgi:hypothetical protein
MALTLHGTVSDNTVALDRKRSVPIVINGDMNIAQRTTSVTGFSSVAGGAVQVIDRITNAISDNGTWTITQDTDVPTGQGFTQSMKLDCTTADTSVASGSFHTIEYRMEGQDLQFIAKGTSGALYLTIAFWFKSSVTGDYAIELMDDDNNRHIGGTFTISSANTWTKVIKSFAGDTTGALGNDTNRSLRFNIFLGAGSDLTSGSAPSSWGSRTTANIAHGQTVNGASSTDNNIYITGLQIEASSSALDANSLPPFQFEDRGTSLGRCQRYFQKSFPQGTDPQNYSSYVAGQSDNSIGATMSSTEFKTVVTLKCEMRGAPTITYYRAQNTPEDSEWTFFDGADKLNPASMASNAQTHRFTAVLTYSSGLTAGNAGLCQGNYTAEAEL